jgi:large subunit ribosomal protein L10
MINTLGVSIDETLRVLYMRKAIDNGRGGLWMPSAKVLEKKKQDVQELSSKLKDATAIMFADYRGLTVEQDTELRNAFRSANVEYRVVKNSITRFAAQEVGITGLEEYLNGPTSIAISIDDPIAPAKILADFSKKYSNLEFKVGVLDGVILDFNKVKELAELPSRDELIAKVVGTLNAPITGLVNVLNGNMRGLVVALNAIAEQKQN